MIEGRRLRDRKNAIEIACDPIVFWSKRIIIYMVEYFIDIVEMFGVEVKILFDIVEIDIYT